MNCSYVRIREYFCTVGGRKVMLWKFSKHWQQFNTSCRVSSRFVSLLLLTSSQLSQCKKTGKFYDCFESLLG